MDDRVNMYRVFHRVPEIMGLDLTLHCGKWEGPYYINRDRHRYKRDKLRVGLWNGNIMVHEQGGESISLVAWLVAYGGASDFKEAFDILKGKNRPLQVAPELRSFVSSVCYIPSSVVEAAREFDLRKCKLFNFMCSIFEPERVVETWKRYNVTTDSNGYAVFWYRDASGNYCFDKRVQYLNNGHRDKTFGGTRIYRTADGFTARPYFGEHLMEDGGKVYVVESEKTALMCSLYYGGCWVATGGKNALKYVSPNMVLVPDMDAVEEWSKKGTIIEWWKYWDEVDSHSDIGDYVEYLIKNNVYYENQGW